MTRYFAVIFKLKYSVQITFNDTRSARLKTIMYNYIVNYSHIDRKKIVQPSNILDRFAYESYIP